MPTRSAVILWSAGSGILLGVFIDAALVGLWALAAAAFPALSPRSTPKWTAAIIASVLVAIPVAAAVLGYLEGTLKAE